MVQLQIRILCGIWLLLANPNSWSQVDGSTESSSVNMEILTPDEWDKVREAIDRGLSYLASTQQRDGSYPAYPTGNPAITSFCVLSFLAQGHQPSQGDYGPPIDQAIDYVLDCQQTDGLITKIPPRNDDIDPSRNPSHTAIYNHAISGLMLSEVYGMVNEIKSEKIRLAIDKAIQHTLNQQMLPKRLKEDIGGWRYIRRHPPEMADSDLSHTSWQLTFLRAAKNAGFDVPSKRIELAVGYVKSRYSPQEGGFRYASRHRQEALNATTGAGILSLSMSGLHNSEIARNSADWLLTRPMNTHVNRSSERYHYTAFLCSMAMYQMGGHHWEQFYPDLVDELLAAQRSNGSWLPGARRFDKEAIWGPAFTTSMAILSLSAPNQLLPAYQR